MKTKTYQTCKENESPVITPTCAECVKFSNWRGAEGIINYEKRRAFLLIDSERERQDAKWGIQNHPPEKWVGILGEEYGEYCQAVNETIFENGPDAKLKGGYDRMMEELTHVAAVAVSAMESLMRNKNK